ncbi:MAG: hypothetical protein ACR2F6_12770 [Mycobacteriales bacterium]
MQTFNMRHDITGRHSGERVVITGGVDDGSTVAFSVAKATMGQIATHVKTSGGVQPHNMRHDSVGGGVVTTFNMRHDVVVAGSADGGVSVSGAADVDGQPQPLQVRFTLDQAGVSGLAHLA